MVRAVLVVVVTCLVPRVAHADGRIEIRVDFNSVNLEGATNQVGLNFSGLEVELEKEFARNKVLLSGVSIGVRRELFYGFTGFGTKKGVDRWDEGTYLLVRIHRNFDVSDEKSWSISPAFAILWGIPGTTLDRTAVRSYADGSEYTHAFPLRNADIPKILADRAELSTSAALVYPEASMALRKGFAKGAIMFDWIFGVRIIRFGIVDSGSQGDAFRVERVFIPSMGLRVGFRVF